MDMTTEQIEELIRIGDRMARRLHECGRSGIDVAPAVAWDATRAEGS